MRALVMALAAGIALSAVATAQTPPSSGNILDGGARWTAEMPAKWNGTLLVWSRGYSTRPTPEAAPEAVRAANRRVAEQAATVKPRTEAVRDRLGDEFILTGPERAHIRGKGEQNVYFLDGLRQG